MSDKKPGLWVRRGLMVSAADGMQQRVEEFCRDERVDPAQCQRLYSNMVQKRQAALQAEQAPVSKPASLDLIVQFYNDRNPLRAMEVEACLRFNLANPHIKRVHLLKEQSTELPEEFVGHPKLTVMPAGRLTFKMAFDYANTLSANSSACLANADIYLDHHSPWHSFTGRLDDLGTFARGKCALTLSRIESNVQGQIWFTKELQRDLAYSYSQDVWVFKVPIQVDDADFNVGNCPGSDNAIAERFHRAGRQPLNLPHVWRVFHLDSARKHFQDPGMVYTNKTDRSHPERRGFRTVPSFAEVRSFADLEAHAWSVDPILQYVQMTDYLAQATNLGHPSGARYDRGTQNTQQQARQKREL